MTNLTVDPQRHQNCRCVGVFGSRVERSIEDTIMYATDLTIANERLVISSTSVRAENHAPPVSAKVPNLPQILCENSQFDSSFLGPSSGCGWSPCGGDAVRLV
jgi:hypothetical protein